MQRLLFFTGIIIQLSSSAQPAWHLIKDKNNIQVYSADVDSSNLKRIKVVGSFDGTLEKTKAIFLDIEGQKNWVYGTKQAYTIKKSKDNEVLYYVETALPWPVSNRDAVIRMKIVENKEANTLDITTVGEPNALAVKKALVRVPQFSGDWTIKVVKNKLAITYLLFINPGGSLPSWVTNLFISKGPYETFSKLSELLKH